MHNPCCGCDLYTDNYSSSLDAGYTQVSGSWSTSAGKLITSSTNALIVHSTTFPDDSGIVQVTLSPNPDDPTPDGAPWRIIGAYLDDDNYLFFESQVFPPGATCVAAGIVGISCWRFRLGKMEAGVETIMDEAFSSDAGMTSLKWRLCWDGTRAVGGTVRFTVSSDYTPPTGGNKAGLGTGATGTSWSFDSFSLHKHNVNASSCPTCGTCWDICETWPDTIEIYFPEDTFASRAFAGGDDWICNGNCENLNDQTFVLTRDTGDALLGFSPGCPRYVYSGAGPCNIENPARAGSYATTIELEVVFTQIYSSLKGGAEMYMNLYSDCDDAVCATSYGNFTRWNWGLTDSLISHEDGIPEWSPCAGDEEYEWEDGFLISSHGWLCNSRIVGGGACNVPSTACILDATKHPVLIF